MKAVFLDSASFGETPLSPLSSVFTELVCYDQTQEQEIIEKAQHFDTVITNKVPLTKDILKALPQLKLILITATGYNHIDIEAAKELEIAVFNAKGYSTASVAEHTIALMLMLMTRCYNYIELVKQKQWSQSTQFCLNDFPHFDCENKTLTLIGYGSIAKRVEKIAKAMGMHVIIAAHKGQKPIGQRTEFNEAIRQADIVSIHCPLTPETENYLSHKEFKLMKPLGLIINTARGPIIDEQALKQALESGQILGAGLDVLSEEPPHEDHPLINCDHPNLIITPHTAWASSEAKFRLMKALLDNIDTFKQGIKSNLY